MADDESDLVAIRNAMFEGPNRDIYLHTGYFMNFFALVEINITYLLGLVLETREPAGFDLLVRGMDARVKVERLRKACKLKERPLGHHIKLRLNYFEQTIIPLRNRLTHAVLTQTDDEGGDGGEWLHFATLVNLSAKAGQPESMRTATLFERGRWLQLFGQDLNALLNEGFAKTLEINNPQSPVPQEGH